ncbi:divalent metal cation transporter [Kribbella aluminosa]|uniref:divalent metal cation transporter n=1 Tax=Kribbella aluminosa TaxID=416017 RepID=UPI0031DDAC1B
MDAGDNRPAPSHLRLDRIGCDLDHIRARRRFDAGDRPDGSETELLPAIRITGNSGDLTNCCRRKNPSCRRKRRLCRRKSRLRTHWRLCWVVVGADLVAVLVQYLAAKASISTGRTLPQLCRDHFKRSTSTGLWAQAEVVALATDLAEVVGGTLAQPDGPAGAIALNLLFHIPLLLGGVITGAVSSAFTGSGQFPWVELKRGGKGAGSARSRLRGYSLAVVRRRSLIPCGPVVRAGASEPRTSRTGISRAQRAFRGRQPALRQRQPATPRQ